MTPEERQKKIAETDHLIERAEKVVSLLKELKQSLVYEGCKYRLHVYKEDNRCSIRVIKTDEELFYGTPTHILSRMETRDIDPKLVYGIEKIKRI